MRRAILLLAALAASGASAQDFRTEETKSVLLTSDLVMLEELKAYLARAMVTCFPFSGLR